MGHHLETFDLILKCSIFHCHITKLKKTMVQKRLIKCWTDKEKSVKRKYSKLLRIMKLKSPNPNSFPDSSEKLKVKIEKVKKDVLQLSSLRRRKYPIVSLVYQENMVLQGQKMKMKKEKEDVPRLSSLRRRK